MSAMTPRSMRQSMQRQDGADAGRRQRRENRERVDVALVEHAEHDVDGDDRGQDRSQPSFASEDWKACAVPWNAASKPGRKRDARLDALDRREPPAPSATPGREVERQRDGRKLTLMVDRERRLTTSSSVRHRRQGHVGCRSVVGT